MFHLAELGRSQRRSTGYTCVCFSAVEHFRILPVWRKAVTPGNNNLDTSDYSNCLNYDLLLVSIHEIDVCFLELQ